MTTVDTERKPLTLSELFGAAVIIGSVWILIGLLWADGHANLGSAFGIEKPITYGLHVVLWPVLVFTDLDLFGIHLT
jgi:hypothetical protein